MSHRPKQLGSVLQRAIQAVIERGFSDPRIEGVITVTSVRVAPDLKNAIVGVTVIPAEHEKLTLHGLRSAAGYIRRQTGELVALHRLPQFEFRIDEQVKKEAGVLAAIHEAMTELESDRADHEPEPTDPDLNPPTPNEDVT